ncbi:MAG: hypothetical protein HFI29_09140 [Lachnospiraceae bacterium]|jgi:chromosome segregation ATPase|nr:hypothetical protein [Lachnospiraceae bacterium]
MALTNEDLLAISQLLDTTLKTELRPIKEDVQSIKGDVQTLQEDVQSIKGDVQSLQGEVQSIKREQTRLNLIIENKISPDIQLLAENYVPAAKRYEKATTQIEAMQADIEIIKKVVAEHSEKLQKIS